MDKQVSCSTRGCMQDRAIGDKYFCHACRDLWRQFCNNNGIGPGYSERSIMRLMAKFQKRYSEPGGVYDG
jgi:hypothetical protein